MHLDINILQAIIVAVVNINLQFLFTVTEMIMYE